MRLVSTCVETKPVFSIPSMKEIKSVKPNGFDLVSTFSGCGGSCLGFRMAGFRTVWANEFIPAARIVYRVNHLGVFVDSNDIRTVKPTGILKVIGKKRGDLDVLEGSPPCASFSMSGSRSSHWGEVKAYSDTRQRTDDLFFEFIRILDGLYPKVFVAENVMGLIQGTAKGYFKEVKKAMEAVGYNVSACKLDAQWLGVPQSRKRIIFIGVRNDLKKNPAFPIPLSYNYSMLEACPWMAKTNTGKDKNTSIEGSCLDSEWDRLRVGESSDKYFNMVKPNPAKPCPTITQRGGSNPGTASVVHPYEKRKFTIREVKRLCSFPDDFRLLGSYAKQWERLGRAVPPLMMKAVAETIRDKILT